MVLIFEFDSNLVSDVFEEVLFLFSLNWGLFSYNLIFGFHNLSFKLF